MRPNHYPLLPSQVQTIRDGLKTCIRLPLPAQPYKAGVLRHGQWDRNWLAFPLPTPESGSPDCLLVSTTQPVYYPHQSEVEEHFAPIFAGLKYSQPAWEIAPGTVVKITDLALERALSNPEDSYADEGPNGEYEGTAAERFAREYEARTGQRLTPGTWVLRVLFRYPYQP